jgi:hypothetical protein
MPFQGAGTEQFFRPELPTWANGSLSAQCARTFSVRFLDHEPLEKIHALTFLQRVELQTQFNRKWKERYAAGAASLTPQEEAVLFLESLEQVKGGLKELRFPTNLPLHVVWWDPIQDAAFAKSWLQNLGNQGNPVVLVSLCTDAAGIDAWVTAQELGDYSFFTLGAESLGPRALSGNLQGGAAMPLDAFFPRERTTLWVAGGLPAEFPSGYNVKTLEDPHVRKKR